MQWRFNFSRRLGLYGCGFSGSTHRYLLFWLVGFGPSVVAAEEQLLIATAGRHITTTRINVESLSESPFVQYFRRVKNAANKRKRKTVEQIWQRQKVNFIKVQF